jgi:hypothetical protein
VRGRRRISVDDRGETLIELLVAMLIMGTATVAVVGGLGTAILMSDVHRKQATIAVFMDTYAAKINGAVAGTNGYKECAGPTTYPSYDPGLPYKAKIESVRFWNGTTYATPCTIGSDPGVQLLTLHVWFEGIPRVDRYMDIVIRRPCRATDAPCL